MTTAALGAIIVGVIGWLLLWANPRRSVNRAIFACSATVAAWLVCKHFLITQPSNALTWLRWSHAAGGLAPISLWAVREGILGTLRVRSGEWIRRNVGWMLSAIVLFLIPFSEVFIPSHSTEVERLRGWGYWVYYVSIIFLYGLLFRGTLLSLRSLTGARKLELQVWLGGGCAVATMVYALSALASLTGSGVFRALQPLAILIFYAGTAYAITSHRIFDARQIVLVGLERAILLLICGGGAYLAYLLVGGEMGGYIMFVMTAAVVLTCYSVVHGWIDEKLQLLPRGDGARKAAFALAQKETRPERLKEEFKSLLRSWSHSERSLLLSGTNEHLEFEGSGGPLSPSIIRILKVLRWATPERLSRERQTPQRIEVLKFLEESELGIVVVEQGASTTVVLGCALRAARRPYTYPEVIQLLELAAIIQAALERAHFSEKAQRAEQLATVGLLGASLAHEIRNPLVTIKTFVQLLPQHYGDVAFRQKFFKLMSDEVSRIDLLTEQLLDLASPRAYLIQKVSLNSLLSTALDLVTAKAAHKGINLHAQLKADPDEVFTDASAAKQVILNLVFNAIQAAELSESGHRWIRLETCNSADVVELAVSDSGSGISPEIRPKLFQPFQTTKSTGFGLGLAICSDILSNISSSISVDAYEPGVGAVFRVRFPCHQS